MFGILTKLVEEPKIDIFHDFQYIKNAHLLLHKLVKATDLEMYFD